MMRRFLGVKMDMNLGCEKCVNYWVKRLHESIVIYQQNNSVVLSDWSLALMAVAWDVDELRPLTLEIWRSMEAGSFGAKN